MNKEVDHILLIDDDTELSALLSQYLVNEGFTVDCIDSGEAALSYLEKPNTASAAVLDIMMPGMSGLDVLRHLRPENRLPIIMLTGRGDDIDRILGLEMGADDYMAKPCNPRELAARLRAVLRRTAPVETPPPPLRKTMQYKGLSLDLGQLSVQYEGRDLGFTSAEFNTLKLLVEHSGEALSKAEITEKVLHRPLETYDRSIDVHVSRIRKKLTVAGVNDPIKSIRGYGYQLVEAQS